MLAGDNKDCVELQDQKAVSGSNSEEVVKIGAKRARRKMSFSSNSSSNSVGIGHCFIGRPTLILKAINHF